MNYPGLPSFCSADSLRGGSARSEHGFTCCGRGFTLIEFMVAIAVIAVLSLTVLSGLSYSTTISNTTKCAANLRSIGVALLSYAADNDGNLPHGVIWDKSIAPYLGGAADGSITMEVFRCPLDERPLAERPRSYTANAMSSNVDRSKVGVFSRNNSDLSAGLNSLEFPHRTIAIAEMYTGNYTSNRQFGGAFSIIDGWTVKRTNMNYYHGKGQNYLFCDGHVETLSDEAVVKPATIGGTLWARER